MKRGTFRHCARRARRYGMTPKQYSDSLRFGWDVFGRTLYGFVHFFRRACGRAPRVSPVRAHFDRVRAWERGR